MPRSPTTLLAELTYRCPLHCPYCSNPLEMTRADAELSTDEWKRVLAEARALGVLQLGLSGGEPLVRRDLEELVAHARALGLYSTLVTSGLGLTPERGRALAEAGIDHVQISFQGARRESADAIAGTRSWDAKHEAAAVVRALGVAFTVNVVLHRANIDQLEAIVEMAEALGADRLELANTQYYGWAALNRDALLPTRAQVERATDVFDRARERYRGRMQMLYVLPDYHGQFPKPCYGGWGAQYIVVVPDGRVLPCHAAAQITTLEWQNVRERALRWIWEESPAFNAFRGEEWMREPCRSCPRRTLDFGGCRCQAFMLTGDAARTDPVCTLSPDRSIVDEALDRASGPLTVRYRHVDPARVRAATLPAGSDASSIPTPTAADPV
ncbi:MAG: pyrroloquinoline quinone biosynthesis protein PqqE [Gemmatimonadaceae bacterium]